jgi:hypothetical protein
MIELSRVELKLLALIFDLSASQAEAEVSRRKLVESLARRGLSGHDIVELITSFNGEGATENILVPKKSKPDYGLCQMPFGRNKGQLFMDLSPYELRSARRWAMSSPELAAKFSEFIRDIGEFLRQ